MKCRLLVQHELVIVLDGLGGLARERSGDVDLTRGQAVGRLGHVGNDLHGDAIEVRLLAPVAIRAGQVGLLVLHELVELERTRAHEVIAEGIAPALDLFLRDDDVAGIRKSGEERGVRGLQHALDRVVINDVAVVEHGEAVHRGLSRGALEGVLDVLGDDGAALLVLASLELSIITDGEGVGETVVGDLPIGGELGNDLGEVDVVVYEGVAHAPDDLGLIGARVLDGVEVLGRGGLANDERAAIGASTGGSRAAIRAAAGERGTRHRCRKDGHTTDERTTRNLEVRHGSSHFGVRTLTPS